MIFVIFFMFFQLVKWAFTNLWLEASFAENVLFTATQRPELLSLALVTPTTSGHLLTLLVLLAQVCCNIACLRFMIASTTFILLQLTRN